MIKGIERTKERADALVDRSRDAVVSGTGTAERKIEQAAQAVVDGTHVAAARIRDGAQTASESAHDGLEGAARALDRGLSRARLDLAAAADRTSTYVASNPGRSLLLAAGVGFVLGMLFRRRRDV